jgi:hypothetical protein
MIRSVTLTTGPICVRTTTISAFGLDAAAHQRPVAVADVERSGMQS